MNRATTIRRESIGDGTHRGIATLRLVITIIAATLIILMQAPYSAMATTAVTAATDTTTATTIPDDVTEFFRTRIPKFVTDNEHDSQNKDALRAIREDPSPEIGDARITYIVGPDDDGILTVTRSDAWSAVVRHASEPTGVATVSRNTTSGKLEPGWSDDTTFARYLIRAERDGGDIVSVPWRHAYFLRKDGTMTALNDAAEPYAPQPVSQQTLLDKLQPEFEDSKAANTQALREGRALVGDATRQEDDADSGPSWRTVLLVAVGTLIVVGAAAGFVITTRANGSS